MARKLTKFELEDRMESCVICDSKKGKAIELDMHGKIDCICLKCIRNAIKTGETYW